MTCAIVFFLDRPFEQVDLDQGFTKAAQLRMVSTNPTEDIVVLVARGFEFITPKTIRRFADMKFKIVDATAELAAVKAKYAWAHEPRVWRNDPFHEMLYMRWLVVEEYFGASPVLVLDGDMVWRVEPYELLKKWSTGGSFICLGCPCITYISGPQWYEVFRGALERMSGDPDYGSEFDKGYFKGIYHDQALLQYLIQIKELENDHANFVGHGFGEKYFLSSNPLNIAPKKGEPPLTFEREGNGERVGGLEVPFWHMQSSFVRYLFQIEAIGRIIGKKDARVPYGRLTKDQEVTPELMLINLLNHIHLRTKKGEIEFHDKRLLALNTMPNRTPVYQAFFDGDLAHRAFSGKVWYKPGVWA